MAIYHFSADLVRRRTHLPDGSVKQRSVVASAAYRAGEKLHDHRAKTTWDYSDKPDVIHSEIYAPDNVPAWVHDRQALWNEVERVEKRHDAQLARDLKIGLPVELTPTQNIDLMRDFIQREFVAAGMIADWSYHNDNPNNPHTHVLLSLRTIGPNGFGNKKREWNQTAALRHWRQAWAEHTNEHLARAGLAVRIDHRSYKDQRINLIPGRKLGVGPERRDHQLPTYLKERLAEQARIQNANGETILKNPTIALDAITRTQAVFTHHDLAKWLHTHTDGADQFQAAYTKLTASSELVALGTDDRNRVRFTTQAMLQIERNLLTQARELAARKGHAVVRPQTPAHISAHDRLNAEQRAAFAHLTAAGDLKALVGIAGSGKSTLLAATREAWEAQGYTVKGAALAGIAVENLQAASGIRARTLASLENAWDKGRDTLSNKDILVIDEAGMIGTRQLAKMIEHAHAAKAKVVLIGDPEQLQPIEAGAAFRGIIERSGFAELQNTRRQQQPWQAAATRQLAQGDTVAALDVYEQEGRVVQISTHEQARSALLARWAKDGQTHPTESRLMLAFTNEDVRHLNQAARTLRQQTGQLGLSQTVDTHNGPRVFAAGDRLYFQERESSLGVKNGTLGSVEGVEDGILHVRLDGDTPRHIHVDPRFYKAFDYGYASTISKTQGSTLDRTYILATGHMDRHSTYVSLSRHREDATLFYAQQDFGGGSPDMTPAGAQTNGDRARTRLIDTLSRSRFKEFAHDYLDASGPHVPATPSSQDHGAGTATPSTADTLAQRFRAALAAPAAPSSLADRFREKVASSVDAAFAVWEKQRSDAHTQDHDADQDLSYD